MAAEGRVAAMRPNSKIRSKVWYPKKRICGKLRLMMEQARAPLAGRRGSGIHERRPPPPAAPTPPLAASGGVSRYKARIRAQRRWKRMATKPAAHPSPT
eukprot:scaffold118843_cov26-Tisochrysis_lutea.AAC.2